MRVLFHALSGQVSAILIDKQKRGATRTLSAAELARQKRSGQLRQLVAGLSSADDVSLVTPSEGEKLFTIRTGV